MAGHGAPTTEPVDCSDLRVAVVAASWHTEVMDGLLAGTQRALEAHGVAEHRLERVPGTFELPVVQRVQPTSTYVPTTLLAGENRTLSREKKLY